MGVQSSLSSYLDGLKGTSGFKGFSMCSRLEVRFPSIFT